MAKHYGERLPALRVSEDVLCQIQVVSNLEQTTLAEAHRLLLAKGLKLYLAERQVLYQFNTKNLLVAG